MKSLEFKIFKVEVRKFNIAFRLHATNLLRSIKVNLKNDKMSWQPRNIPWFWRGEPVIAVPVFIPVPVVAAAAQPPPRTEKARRLKCFLCRRRDWPDPLSELYHGAACGMILCFTCVAEVYSGSRNRGSSWRPDFVLEEILTNEVQYE